MAVQQALGITELVEAADATWPQWSEPEAAVARFGSVSEVERWRDTATRDEIEEFFEALGRLTSSEASHRAVAVMVQLLVPGVEGLVSRRCRGATARREVESVAAGYVWTTILTYPWQAPTDVWIPAALLRTVGRAVDREFGWGDRGEGAWRSRTYLGSDTFDRMVTRSHSDQPVQASAVYWWAVTKGLVSTADLDLLLQLAVIASEEGISTRSNAGITSRMACGQIADDQELTIDQVQYRALKALSALRAHASSTISP